MCKARMIYERIELVQSLFYQINVLTLLIPTFKSPHLISKAKITPHPICK